MNDIHVSSRLLRRDSDLSPRLQNGKTSFTGGSILYSLQHYQDYRRFCLSTKRQVSSPRSQTWTTWKVVSVWLKYKICIIYQLRNFEPLLWTSVWINNPWVRLVVKVIIFLLLLSVCTWRQVELCTTHESHFTFCCYYCYR